MAGNVLAHGTGALNVDGCRIDSDVLDSERRSSSTGTSDVAALAFGTTKDRPPQFDGERHNPAGRWPANVTLDPEAAAMLDEQTGERRSAGEYTKGSRGGANDFVGPASINIDGMTAAQYSDGGGASRFFYVAKADAAERNLGLHGERNIHPTVKPVALMRWLCRLITPPGGLVLDPFAGSGTTGIAALREGFSFVGLEQDADYVRVARARIIGDAPLINGTTEEAA